MESEIEKNHGRVRWETIFLGLCLVVAAAFFANGMKALGEGIAGVGVEVSEVGDQIVEVGDLVSQTGGDLAELGDDLVTAAGRVENASKDYSDSVVRLQSIAREDLRAQR